MSRPSLNPSAQMLRACRRRAQRLRLLPCQYAMGRPLRSARRARKYGRSLRGILILIMSLITILIMILCGIEDPRGRANLAQVALPSVLPRPTSAGLGESSLQSWKGMMRGFCHAEVLHHHFARASADRAATALPANSRRLV